MKKNFPGAVIWDMDGVLADTGPFHFEAWEKIFKELKIPFTREDFRKTFGMRNDQILEKFLRKELSSKEVSKIGDKKEIYFRKGAKGKLKPPRGLIKILSSLKKRGFKMAMASSGPPENVKFVVEELGIRNYFEVLLSGKDATCSKPHPGIFLKAAERLRVSPEICIVIEDAVVGIEAARRAGMKAIALCGTHPKEAFLEADLVVESLEELEIEDFEKLFKNR